MRTALVQLLSLSSADCERRRELRSGEDTADSFRVVPVGVKNEDALLIWGQTAHGAEYIEERPNSAIMAQSSPQFGQCDRRVLWGRSFSLRKNEQLPWYSS